MSEGYRSGVALLALTRKEIARVLRIWPQTLLPSVIISILYFMIFGRIIGSRVGHMGGVPYMQFIVPGLVMLAVINNAYSNVASSFYGAKFSRSIEEMLISPMSGGYVLAGYLLGGLFRAVLNGALVMVVAHFMAGIHVMHVWLTLFVMLITALIFSTAGFINGMLANSFDGVAFVPTFVLTPLIYLGGVFYQVSLLPHVWQVLTRVNPVFYLIDSFRQSMLSVQPHMGRDLLMFVVFLCVLMTAALLQYTHSKRLRA